MLDELHRFVDENAERYIEWLKRLCRQPSVAAQGRGMSETATMVTELLEAVGLSAEQLPTSGYPVVYGTVAAGRKRTLSFYNHYDVQPEDPLEQ